MAAAASRLFEPIEVGAWTLRNRMAMAPLTRSRADSEGLPSDLHATYYGQRAGAGLIVAEATQISPEGQGYLRTPGIYSEAQIGAWRRVTDAVHRGGGTIVLQLWHVGRIAHPANRIVAAPPVGPSPIAAAGTIFTPDGLVPFPTPRALATDVCARVADDYAAAARNALRAGFDGVEIHGANGYLLDAFLHDGSNRRDDRYGGSVENRTRLLVEVVEAVAAAIGADRTGARLSPFGSFNDASDSDPAALFDHVIRRLDRLDIAYLHVIKPEVSGDRSAGPDGSVVDVPRFARQRFAGRLIVAGGYDKAAAERELAAGTADLVAFGRAFIANPDLPERLKVGAALTAADRTTFYTPGPKGYIDYPALGGA
ncbi:alkene reductase [Chelatococcus reniformis]|uniref:Alkene reductase n=1 Tax=Chelatococcus reniformis TaxID=1494448 RepID=A0A916U9R2_9HYPH|nr:alkene reductase [Chelatococcus reniformis]GGC64970.1 alkene reductase [Chelatococcus reniformis]